MRDGWRPLVWLGSLFVVIAGVASSGAVAGGPEGALLVGVVGSPVVFLWTWWTQHLFLGGRTAYRRLVPGAVATTAGLAGLSLFNSVYLSSSITQNFDKYGPIGVVFALLSWLIGFNVLIIVAVVFGVVVMVNYLSHDYFLRLHVSTQNQVKLFPRTVKLLHNLTNTVRVTM